MTHIGTEAPPVVSSTADQAPNLAEELASMEYVPLLPIEKKLIAWSLVIGSTLLLILTWLTHAFHVR